MPKYRVIVREDVWYTYEIETDLTDVKAIEDLFYELTEEDQKKALIDTDSFCFEIDAIEPIQEGAHDV